jgi:murein DD-endopeptidase MepM/ murein hydrolase activator NlpD
MKLKLTEQQVYNLIQNLNEQVVDIETPNLSKLAQALFTKPTTNDTGVNIGADINSITNTANSKPLPGPLSFAPNVPKGNEMMHPLGRKQTITSPFGGRNTGIAGATTNHKGIDITTPSNSPVYAPLDGMVIASRDTTPNACGGFIKLEHDTVETKYCHLSRMVVRTGQQVKKGQVIGYTGGGETDPHHGISSGPHLHYEILDKNGVAMNPTSVQSNLT